MISEIILGVWYVPVYEFRCEDCQRRLEILVKSVSAGVRQMPNCAQCGSTRMKRLISRVTIVKSWGEGLSGIGSEAMGDVDEDDPGAMQSWMRRMREDMGDDSGHLGEEDMLDLGIPPGDTLL